MKKIPKCPKCRKLPISLKEIYDKCVLEFDVDENGNISKEGYKNEGYPNGVDAYCICGNIWKVRGVIQITDFEGKAL